MLSVGALLVLYTDLGDSSITKIAAAYPKDRAHGKTIKISSVLSWETGPNHDLCPHSSKVHT